MSIMLQKLAVARMASSSEVASVETTATRLPSAVSDSISKVFIFIIKVVLGKICEWKIIVGFIYTRTLGWALIGVQHYLSALWGSEKLNYNGITDNIESQSKTLYSPLRVILLVAPHVSRSGSGAIVTATAITPCPTLTNNMTWNTIASIHRPCVGVVAENV